MSQRYSHGRSTPNKVARMIVWPNDGLPWPTASCIGITFHLLVGESQPDETCPGPHGIIILSSVYDSISVKQVSPPITVSSVLFSGSFGLCHPFWTKRPGHVSPLEHIPRFLWGYSTTYLQYGEIKDDHHSAPKGAVFRRQVGLLSTCSHGPECSRSHMRSRQ